MARNKLLGMAKAQREELEACRRECLRLAVKNLDLQMEVLALKTTLWKTRDECRELADRFQLNS